MNPLKINHVAVWFFVVLYPGLSILWFSPLLFAYKWMAYPDKTLSNFNGESIPGLISSLISAVLLVYLMAQTIEYTKRNTGPWAFFPFLAGVLFLQTFTRHSFYLRLVGLTLINSGILLINFCMGGLILGSWKKLNSTKICV